MTTAEPSSSWATRLGFGTRELRAWVWYDWANSAFMTTIVAAVFPIYFAQVAAADLPPAEATFRFSLATTIALALVTLVSPILGAVADFSAAKKRLLGVSMGAGVVVTAAMSFIERGDWVLALVLFGLGNIALYASLVFYDSLLPHLAGPAEIDRVSTAGYAFGYLGGGLLLAINLAWIQAPGIFGLPDSGTGVRLSFASVALWWLVFSLPLLRRVPEPPAVLETDERAGMNPVSVAFTRVGETLASLRVLKHAFLFLLAFLVYNDGINTIVRMATLFGAEIGIGQSHLIGALLLVQFLGVPFAFAFGRLAGYLGPKHAIFLSLVVYAATTLLAYFMTSALHFYLLAILVATVQGGSQALSRSLFATMIPRHKSSEMFGFFSISEKFSGIFGPLIFAIAIRVSGSSRSAVLTVAALFVIGAALLTLVDVEAGRRQARDAERTGLLKVSSGAAD